MKTYTTKELTDKIIGKIKPVGDTSEDNIRYENLEELIGVVGCYISEIHDISMRKDAVEYSIKHAGMRAFNFIDMLKDYND